MDEVGWQQEPVELRAPDAFDPSRCSQARVCTLARWSSSQAGPPWKARS